MADGSVSCVEAADCKAMCYIWGDPHYTTFDKVSYSFMGKCIHTLVRNRCEQDEYDFEIAADQVPCGDSGQSCAKDVHINLVENGIKKSLVLVRGKPKEFYDGKDMNGLVKMDHMEAGSVVVTLLKYGEPRMLC